MQNEKIAAIALVIIIVGSLSGYLVVTYREDILKNLFGEKKGEEEVIALGDCVDVHYIGRYASNDTVFDTSYADVENKTGGTPLKVFVSLNKTATPPEGYTSYVSSILGMGQEYIYYTSSPLAVMDGFIQALIGMGAGEKKTTDVLSPEKAFGVTPQVGDKLNLTPYFVVTYELKIIEIQENVSMPSDFQQIFGNVTTSLYMLREDWHYIGEIIDTEYLSWENSTVVTKINETMLWKYTTPTTDVGENFTWVDVDSETGIQIAYPESTSSISSRNNSTIVVTHNPEVNMTIDVSSLIYGSVSYTIENITADTINASYIFDPSTENKTYQEFDRNIIIQRNETQSINKPLFEIFGLDQSLIPGEVVELLLLTLRLDPQNPDSNFKLSYNSLTDETVYFEVEIVKVDKTSQES